MVQLRAMSETSVLITPCGGTGTVLTFLPPGATAIVMNYWVPAHNASVQMESLYYWVNPALLASWILTGFIHESSEKFLAPAGC